ncbi:MAG: hypothetical protein JJT77_00870 [Crocinitomicaceae bacterium]|nr:hypothetical protein [Crocinitomicaceae bacterium]
MQSSEYQLNKFVEYIRTKQFMLNALKGVDPNTFVFISMNEIKSRFLVNPHEDIKNLVQAGEIEVQENHNSKRHKYTSYKVLKAGYYDLNLLEPKGKELTTTTERMMNILKDVSLKKDSPSTQYFNSFLEYKNNLLRTFFNVDVFSGRVHTPITSFKGEYRKNILIDELETISIDVVTMQPLLLGSILKSKIGENEYSNWIDTGEDIYLMLQSKAKLSTRDEAKKRFFEILFSRPNDSLKKMFGNSTWIEWINEFKRQPFTPNPHTLEKNHSNLAWLLQTSEVTIMTEVWSCLLDAGVKFLSVHDEVIVKHTDYKKAKDIFSSVLSKHLTFFKLSDKQITIEKQSNNSHKTVIAPPQDKVKKDTIKKTPLPKKGELYSINELKTKFQLSDEFIKQNFDEFYHNIGWINI